MKRLLMIVCVLAMASSAMAATFGLTMLPASNPGTRNDKTILQYHVQGLTDDGAYAVATLDDGAGNPNGVLITKVSDLSTTVYNDRSGMAGRGISTAPGGLAVAGAVHSNGDLGIAYNAGSSSGSYLLTNSGTGSESQVAVQNAISLDPTTGDGFLVGNRLHSKGKQGLAWRYTGGNLASTTAIWGRTANSVNTDLNGVSNDGIAVGSASYPILADVANNLLPSNIPAFANTSTGQGQGNGISADHMYSTGFMQHLIASDDALHAFRHTYGGSTEELLPAGGDLTGYQQSNGFDAANTGLVVGFTYDRGSDGLPFDGYRATVWLPGSTTGLLLEDILAANGVDLTDWQYLERSISVTADGTTIAGRGVLASDGSYRGFVATIPEPATMTLLALGGLMLLRRRA